MECLHFSGKTYGMVTCYPNNIQNYIRLPNQTAARYHQSSKSKTFHLSSTCRYRFRHSLNISRCNNFYKTSFLQHSMTLGTIFGTPQDSLRLESINTLWDIVWHLLTLTGCGQVLVKGVTKSSSGYCSKIDSTQGTFSDARTDRKSVV